MVNRCLLQLKIPDPDSGVSVNQHRAAGLSRWASAHGVGA
jgi:hypothetical protein